MNIKMNVNGVEKEFNDKNKAIEFLENQQENGKSWEENIKDKVIPILKKYPKIDRINICSIGNFYKYESAGSSYFSKFYESNEDLEDATDLYENIEDILNEINVEIKDLINEKDIARRYGYHAPGIQFVIFNNDGRYSLDIDDYDPE